ncbi:facilitated trehalose transporter Tret1-like [Photinus pyralis]|uniref:facilitated trehalose transporter Tret1-like n=1 Tax=Photinus pyralis TaxID=7054 RepID=UPI0012676007|nr:facilitated trehalose transporter Tret1-like [Photinus pyralis]
MEVHDVSKQSEKSHKSHDTIFIGKVRQIIATVCLGPICFGVAFTWTSPVLPQLLEGNATNFSGTGLSVSDGSWVGSMVAIGELVASVPLGYLVGRYGAKICTLLLLVPMLIFTFIAIFLNDVYSLCIARFFSGMATGGICVVGPVYISEISQISFRGVLGSLFEMLIYVGMVFVSVIGAYLDYIKLTIIVGVLNLLIGLVFFYLPDSPTHLIKMNKREKAAKALRFYRHSNYEVDNDLDELYERIHKAERSERFTIETLKSRVVIRGLIATVGLTIFQQLSGIDGIAFYLVQIFQAAQTNIDDYTSAIIVAVAQFVSALIVLFIIEKANRKTFLHVSAIGMAVCLAAVGAFYQLKKNDIYFPGLNAIPIVGLVMHAFAYSVGLGPIPWIVNGECFAADVSGVANGIIMTVNVFVLFLITKISPIVMDSHGTEYVFYFYAICMVLCVVFVHFCVIETKGKSLHAIQLELSS